MYLFSRNNTANPERILDAMAFAVDITERVNSITGLDVHAWTGVYGVPLGFVSWTATVSSRAAIGAAGEKLMADASYLEALEGAAGLFADSPQDSLADVVAAVGDKGHGGDYAEVVTAEVAPGRLVDAMTWSVEILNYAHGVTGLDGAFARGLYGPFGGVGWISLAASLDEIDAATSATAADEGYLSRIDGAEGLFQPDATTTLTRRIA